VSPTFRQFVLIGGDASVGHFFYPHPVPVVETQPHTAYPGCYALSKALEEAMLQQYYIQYDFNGCCLRAPWIMEKDDLRAHLSFGSDVFGGPRWCDVVGAEAAAEYEARGAIPVLQDREGNGLLRNFVHVEDLADAILAALDQPRARQQLMNVCMDEPLDYSRVAEVEYAGETPAKLHQGRDGIEPFRIPAHTAVHLLAIVDRPGEVTRRQTRIEETMESRSTDKRNVPEHFFQPHNPLTIFVQSQRRRDA
jgi:hypothetical protein